VDRIRNVFSQFGPSIAFYRDDIEEIFAILNAACKKVTISDGTHSFSAVDELIQAKGSRPRELSLHSESPYVSLSIKPLSVTGVHLFAERSEDAEFPFLKIKEYLRSRAPRLGLPFPYPVAWVLLAMGILANVVDLRFPDLIPTWIPLAFNIAAFISFTILLIERGCFCRIRLERRHEATTFWSRNGERLIVVLIGVILGALGKELVTWVIKMLK